MSRYKNIVFDVGSVLVNWMRMNLYTTLFNGKPGLKAAIKCLPLI